MPPYIKEGEGEVRPAQGVRLGGVLLPPGVGIPPLALLEKEGGREKEERGALPPLPCPIQTPRGAAGQGGRAKEESSS